MRKPIQEDELQSMIAEIQAQAKAYTERLKHGGLRLIKTTMTATEAADELEHRAQELEQATRRTATAARVLADSIRSGRADRVQFTSNGLALLSYDSEPSKRCNGVAARRRNKLVVKRGGKLTDAEIAFLDKIYYEILEQYEHETGGDKGAK